MVGVASLHFSGHTFNISSCLNVAPNVNVNRISTEIKAYPNYSSGGLGAGAPKTLEPNEYIDCRSLLAADLGHILVMWTFSSKCESVESRLDLALFN